MNIFLLVFIALGLIVTMTIAWGLQRLTSQSGWIDSIWSLSVGFFGAAAALLNAGDATRRYVILTLVLLWSLRLGTHIAKRTMGSGEDPRYEKLIEEWGRAASLRLFLFLQIQALAAFILVLAVFLAAGNPEPLSPMTDMIAILVGAVALAGEAVADAQLQRFRQENKTKSAICENGLWAYSRHPNYFFEWLFWLSWPIFVAGSLLPFTLALLAPLMMYYLLVHVSGIPPLEAHMLRSRGEAFIRYQARVNAFFPGPRKWA